MILMYSLLLILPLVHMSFVPLQYWIEKKALVNEFIYIAANVSTSFFLWLSSISLYKPHLLNPIIC